MSVTVDLGVDLQERLEAEADRRGVDVTAVIARLVESLPEPDTRPPHDRRRLSIIGIGASGGERGSAADDEELLAEGFGRS